MAAMDTKKRKREAGPPRVTFSTPTRTFERLLKESSLGALRSAVSKKLGLDSKNSLELCQVRDGKTIDLEDEDDFDAFRSYAASNGVAEVKITSSIATSEPPPQTGSADTRQDVSQALGRKGHSQSGVRDKAASFPQDATLKAPSKSAQVKLRKPARQPAPSASPRSTLAEDTEGSHETLGPDRNLNPLQALASASIEAEKGVEDPAAPAGIPSGAGTLLLPPPQQESIEAPKSAHLKKTGKDGTKEKEKKSRKKSNAADAIPMRIDGVVSPVTPAAQPLAASPPEPRSETVEPAQESKKPRAKKRKTSAGLEARENLDGRHTDMNLPQSSLPSGTAELDKQSEEQRPKGTTDKGSTAPDEPGAKKRKRDDSGKADEETAASKTVKSKKPKADNGGETESSSQAPPDVVSTDAKRKSSRTKKQSRATPEEELQVQEAIDSAIAKVLAKRVSASSKQIASTEPVTTTVSSAQNEGIDVTGADEQAASKRRKRRRRKSTAVSSSKPSAKASESVPEQTGPESDVLGNDSSSVKVDRHPTQDVLQEEQPGQAVSQLAVIIGQTVPVESSFPQTTETIEEQDFTEIASGTQTQTTRLTSQLKSDTCKSRPLSDDADLPAAAADKATGLLTKDDDPCVSPEIVQQRLSPGGGSADQRGEDSSSDSDSDSDSDTSEDVPLDLKVQAPGDASSLSHVPTSSFAITDLNIDDAIMDIDSLLNPKEHVSWQKILEESGDEEKQELMSDIGEEEEEEENRKESRKVLSVRYAPSTASEGDDVEEDIKDDIESESAGSAEESEPTSDIESFSGGVAQKVETGSQAETTTAVSSRAGVPQDGPPLKTPSNEPNPNTLPSNGTQSRPSPPLPTFTDVNDRGESVLTEHVADNIVDRAMEEDDTLFLTSLRKFGQEARPLGPSSAGDVASKSTRATSAQSLDKTADCIDSHDEASLKFLNESRNRISSSALQLPSVTDRPHSLKDAEDTDATGIPQSSQDIPFSQSSTLRMSSGMIKRMRGRNGKKAEAIDFLSQPETLLKDDHSIQSPGARGLDHSEPPQPPQRTGSDTSQAVELQSPVLTNNLCPVNGIDEVPSKSGRPAVATTSTVKRDRPRTRAETAARPSPQKMPSTLPKSTRPVPGRSLSKQAAGAQHTSSQPPSALKSSADSGSTTEVDRSETGETERPDPTPPLSIPVKNGSSHRSPTPSEAEEDSETDDSDDGPLLNKANSRTPRSSVVGLRSLRSLASQPELFSPASAPRPSFALPPTARLGSQTPAPVNGDDDSDSDDSSTSSSDSDGDEQSTIPKEKRAGRTTSSRKKELFV